MAIVKSLFSKKKSDNKINLPTRDRKLLIRGFSFLADQYTIYAQFYDWQSCREKSLQIDNYLNTYLEVAELFYEVGARYLIDFGASYDAIIFLKKLKNIHSKLLIQIIKILKKH